MNKQAFLSRLRKELSGLPRNELEERLTFYSEMIDDRMEEGLSEEEAVAAAGSVDEIVWQIIAEVPFKKIAKEKIKTQRRLSAWEIVLLVLGSPVWLSLLIAAIAVIISVYVVLWSAIVSLWAVFASLIGCAFGAIIGGAGFAVGGFGATGMALVGVGLVCAGLAILLFFGCKAATKGISTLTKLCAFGIKKRFVKKEGT